MVSGPAMDQSVFKQQTHYDRNTNVVHSMKTSIGGPDLASPVIGKIDRSEYSGVKNNRRFPCRRKNEKWEAL